MQAKKHRFFMHEAKNINLTSVELFPKQSSADRQASVAKLDPVRIL